MSGLPVDTCLQCEQSRAEVKAKDTICGIVSGYEYVELDHEWPRHHWRGWADSELSTIKPEVRGDYRRARLVDIQYADCEDTVSGHRPAEQDDPDWGLEQGRCVDCGKKDIT